MHSVVKIGGRRFGVANRQIAERPRHMQLGLARREPHGRGEIVDGELVLMLALIEEAALIICLGIVRLERDGLVQVGKRLRAPALFTVDMPRPSTAGT